MFFVHQYIKSTTNSHIIIVYIILSMQRILFTLPKGVAQTNKQTSVCCKIFSGFFFADQNLAKFTQIVSEYSLWFKSIEMKFSQLVESNLVFQSVCGKV